jgi:hypothetical protein
MALADAEALLASAWALAGRTPPVLAPLAENDLPEGVRALMSGGGGMTAALIARWGAPIGLRMAGRRVEERGNTLLRLVALQRPGDRVPVEVAAIRIHLAPLGAAPRAAVLAGDTPFGTILARAGIAFRSEARAWFRVEADTLLAELGGVDRGAELAGRLAVLTGTGGILLASAVEILPRW